MSSDGGGAIRAAGIKSQLVRLKSEEDARTRAASTRRNSASRAAGDPSSSAS